MLLDKILQLALSLLKNGNHKIFAQDVLVICLLLFFGGINFFGESNIAPRILGNIIAINDLIIYPEGSLVAGYYNSSSSLLVLLGAALSKLLTIRELSIVIFSLQILVSFFAIRMIVCSFDKMMSDRFTRTSHSCIAFFFMFTACSLGFPDYPILFVTQHTFGGFQEALILLFVGLFLANRTLVASFLLPIIFLTHPVSGLISATIMATAFIVQFTLQKAPNKSLFLSGYPFFKHCLIGMCLLVVSIIVWASYNDGLLENISALQPKSDQVSSFYNLYIESHRDKELSVIFLLACFGLMMGLIFSKHIDYWFRNRLLFICSVCLCFYCLKPFYPEFFSKLMLSRAALIPSVLLCIFLVLRCLSYVPQLLHVPIFFVGTALSLIVRELHPLICLSVSILLMIAINRVFQFKSNKIVFFTGVSALALSLTLALTASSNTPNDVLSKIKMRVFPDSNMICKDLTNGEEKETEGLFVTVSSLGEAAQVCLKLPLLIDPGTLDIFSYFSEGVQRLEGVVKDIYGIDTNGFPEEWRNRGGLKDIWYQNIWENRSLLEWRAVAYDHGFEGVIVPEYWRVNLKCSRAVLMPHVKICYVRN